MAFLSHICSKVLFYLRSGRTARQQPREERARAALVVSVEENFEPPHFQLQAVTALPSHAA